MLKLFEDNKDRDYDRDSYDINKAAKDIADKCKKNSQK